MAKAAVVASGGMDSATLAWHYHRQGMDVHLIGFNYGQRHAKELDFLQVIAQKINADFTIVDMGFMSDLLHGSALTAEGGEVPDGHYREETMRQTVVPNRNAIMLSIATGIAVAEGCELVATGIHSGDHYIYPDCRPQFFEPLQAAFKAGTEGHAHPDFRLEAPFIQKTKADIAAYGHELHVDYANTWSCYKGGEVHCGRCGTCVERIEAFIDAKVDDPTVYADGIEFAVAEIEKRRV
jgi:7-cyano-7-deazaguanine synthase